MAFNIIDRTAGTNIGDMSANGGLAAAFDGVTSQAASACARKNIGGAGSAYVGKTLAAEKRFGKAIVYGSNDSGFVAGTHTSVTINIRGKDGTAPSSATDGTVIGTTSFTDTSDESAGRTILSTDGATYWDHIFAQIAISGGSGDGNAYVAELELYEFNPVGVSVVFIG